MTDTKKLLIVAYYFPPMGGIPVQRTLKFVRKLPGFGWEPVILTVKDGIDHFHPNDPSLMKRVPVETTIFRAREFTLTAKAIKFLRDNVRGMKKEKLSNKEKPDFVGRLRSILYNTLWFPDEKNSWIPCGFLEGRKVLRQENISAIFATGYPWSAFLVAYFLSNISGKPLIIDYRDAWTLNQRKFWDSPWQRFWEKKVLSHAAKVIFVTDVMRQNHIEAYPDIDPGKFITITNGFDREDYQDLPQQPVKNERLLITYTGTFNDNVPPMDIDRSPYYFLKALSDLQKEGDFAEKLKVRFVGQFGVNNTKSVKEMELEGVVELTGSVPYARSVEFQKKADVFLLIIAPCKGSRDALTGKLFEYIATGKPILALVPDGEAKRLIDDNRLGPTVHSNDVAGIKDCLKSLVTSWENDSLQLSSGRETMEKFEVGELTRQLAGVLDAACHD